MANTTDTTTKGSNITRPTTLSPEMLARHKLKGNSVDAQRYKSFRNEAKVKQFSRMVSTYRLLNHGVTTNHRLASPLRSMCHFFAIPMSKMDSDNPRDRKASYGETAPAQAPVAAKVVAVNTP